MDGVLLATYGSPKGPDDVARYLEDIIGREPTPAQVEGLQEQYRAAGGFDRLPKTTEAQARALSDRLDDTTVEIGYLHSPPFIDDVVEELAGRVDRGVVVPLAPHYNTKSVQGYLDMARDGRDRADGAPFAFVRSYPTQPDLVAAWADRLGDALEAAPDSALVLFTAHSLPRSVLDDDDPYPDQVQATCEAVAGAVDVDRWRQVYQSAPPHGDWLGPDVSEAIRAAGDVPGVVVCPVGFVSDHMETRYDLDVEARETAEEVGLDFVRVPAPGDDPRFVDCLVDVVGSHRP